VVICLKRGADCLHMVQMMPLHPKTPSYLASFKSRLVLLFWYRLTQVVLEMRLDLLCKGFCKLSVFVELLNSLWIVEVPA